MSNPSFQAPHSYLPKHPTDTYPSFPQLPTRASHSYLPKLPTVTYPSFSQLPTQASHSYLPKLPIVTYTSFPTCNLPKFLHQATHWSTQASTAHFQRCQQPMHPYSSKRILPTLLKVPITSYPYCQKQHKTTSSNINLPILPTNGPCV